MDGALVGNFLRARPGRGFCRICLSEMLDITLEDAAIERLRGMEGFNVSAGECANCGEDRIVARFVRSP